MPPAKRASSSRSDSKSSSKPATGAKATRAAASRGTKATTTSAAKTPGSGARGTAAKRGAQSTRSTAQRAATSNRRAGGGDGITTIAEQLVKGTINPSDLVMLTRERIRETIDEAASRGRVTRKDADALVTELVRRGRSQSEDFRSEIESLLGRVETATKRARGSQPVDRLVRGADRARRAAGVGSSFPIVDYDSLNVAQVRARLGDLDKPERRKVLTYERKHANRKTVVGAIEKSLN